MQIKSLPLPPFSLTKHSFMLFSHTPFTPHSRSGSGFMASSRHPRASICSQPIISSSLFPVTVLTPPPQVVKSTSAYFCAQLVLQYTWRVRHGSSNKMCSHPPFAISPHLCSIPHPLSAPDLPETHAEHFLLHQLLQLPNPSHDFSWNLLPYSISFPEWFFHNIETF